MIAAPQTRTRRAQHRSARRQFLRWSTAFAAGLLTAAPLRGLVAAGRPQGRILKLQHAFSGESLQVIYRRPSGYDASALAAVSQLMRDRVTGEVKPVDPGLLDYLYAVQSRLAGTRPLTINSGYRSRQTNARLRRAGEGAVRNSYHVKGKAADVWMPGVETAVLRRAALEIRAGGVGYYPDRHFVHLDVGPVRHWTNKEAT